MRKVIVSLLSCFALGAMAQTQLTNADLTNAYKTRSYTGRVSCHDPSIVLDNISHPSQPTYYIYGSHLGRGKTTTADNYQKWTSFKVGEESTDATNSLFADVKGNLVNYSEAYNTHAITEVKNYKGETVQFGNFNAHEWQFEGTAVQGNQWAPDMVYNKTMKKWCMYMSLNGDHWGSSIVCFTSDNIEGPWVYQGPVVFSGFQGTYAHNGFSATDDWKHTDLAIATGATSLPTRYKVGTSWGRYWPNCIDPCVFYDDDDNLWMSYGSWSGGIFMIRLNKENGLRDYTYQFPYEVNGKTATPGSANLNTTSDPYFGKKIAGGYYVSGEASYIEKIGKYYFLFMSYGYLSSNGGYQMRIFRSENPDGPFVDCYGTSAVYSSGYVLNYGAKGTDNRGVLLFGGYQWDTMSGAELAQGHNSAFTDEKGRSFVVYHTRFSNGGEGHQVRVHQLFLNDEGWLMAAPFEFDGETITNDDIATKASIDDSEIAGDYQFMRHQYNQDTEAKSFEKPVNITLHEDGSISGGVTGTWKRTAGTDYIHLTIGGVVYRGALVRQTIDYTNISALAIVALSSSSGSLTIGQNTFTRQQEVWAVKAATKPAIKYSLDKLGVSIPTTVTSNLALPTEGKLGASLSWKSSNTSVMTDEGEVVGKGNINLTLTISKDGYEYSKKYYCYVNAPSTATPIYYPESSIKNTTNAFWTSFSDYYDLQVGKKMEFKFYNYSAKGKNWYNWVLVAATAARGASVYSEYFVLRNDSYGWFTALGGNTNENTANVTFTKNDDFNFDTFQTDMDGSLVDMIVGLDANGKLSMTSKITTKAQKVYNYSFSMVLTSKPSQVKLFFTGEKSYIDGSLVTGITNPVLAKGKNDGKWYNLAGQQVDRCYKGIVVVNGKKFVNK